MENPFALGIVVLSIFITFYISWYSRRWTRTTTDFYVAGGQIPWKLNGLAMFGDYSSAASFLGIAGAIALSGLDSWWIALGFFAAWIVVLFILAGPLKNTGKFTVGDVLASRFDGPVVKMLAMIITIIIGTLYLVPQIVGAGHLFELLLGWNYLTTVVIVGALMGLLVVMGGMRGTTYNQAFQGIVLMFAMAALLILSVVLYFDFNPFNILSMAGETVPPSLAQATAGGVMAANPEVGAQALIDAVRGEMAEAATAMTPGVAVRDALNQFSLVLGLFLGVLGLPHILIRFYTVKDSKNAQKSAAATIAGLAVFYIMVLFVGLAAMMLLYPDLNQLLLEGERGKATNMTVPMLGNMLGGEVFMGIIAAGAMAAMISTSVGLLISMTTSLSHDVYAGVLRPKSSEKERLMFAKFGAAGLTIIAILASIWLKEENVAVLVGMCFGIAASTFAPVLVSVVWSKRLTKEAVITAMFVGLVVSLTFTFARFLNVDSILGLPVLVNPALYGVVASVSSLILVSYFTTNVGRAEEVLAIAHKES